MTIEPQALLMAILAYTTSLGGLVWFIGAQFSQVRKTIYEIRDEFRDRQENHALRLQRLELITDREGRHIAPGNVSSNGRA